MKTQNKSLALVIIAALLVSCYPLLKRRHAHNSLAQTEHADATTPIEHKTIPAVANLSGGTSGAPVTLTYQDDKGATQTEVLTESQHSIATMALAMAEFSDSARRPEDFVKFLKEQGLKPVMVTDPVEGMNDLAIIRTQNSLPGIRYIHGQFDNDDGDMSLQHMSFELPKGPTTRADALALIQKIMPLGQPVEGTDESMTIFRKNGYVIWLKELAVEDMKGDPFNAYDYSADVGNVRVAIEREIHEVE
jgi:hypothetical protein